MLSSNPDYDEIRNATLLACKSLYPASTECNMANAVVESWQAVGIGDDMTTNIKLNSWYDDVNDKVVVDFNNKNVRFGPNIFTINVVEHSSGNVNSTTVNALPNSLILNNVFPGINFQACDRYTVGLLTYDKCKSQMYNATDDVVIPDASNSPELVLNELKNSPDIIIGEEQRIEVEVENLGYSTATGTLQVDIIDNSSTVFSSVTTESISVDAQQSETYYLNITPSNSLVNGNGVIKVSIVGVAPMQCSGGVDEIESNVDFQCRKTPLKWDVDYYATGDALRSQLEEIPNTSSITWTVTDLTAQAVVYTNSFAPNIHQTLLANPVECTNYSIQYTYVDDCSGGATYTDEKIFNTKIKSEYALPPVGTARIITSDENWTTDDVINGIVYVQPGVTLTISGATIEFSEYANEHFNKLDEDYQFAFDNFHSGIIVRQGGILRIINSTLTSSCANSQWHGITVLGDPLETVDVNSNPGQQGWAIVENSTIENARTGIRSLDGGIVGCLDNTFINNTVGVEIKDRIDHLVAIDNCTFLTDNNFPKINSTDPDMKAFIVAENAFVKVLGCDFENQNTGYLNAEDYGTGVLAYNSDITIEPDKFGSVGGGYITSKNDPSTFTGLFKGLDYYGISNTNNAVVKNATFTAIPKSITLNGGKFHEIRNNTIIISPVPVGASGKLSSYGVFVYDGSEVRVYDNDISSINFQESVGIVRRGFGLYAPSITANDGSVALIHGNKITNTGIAIQHEGINNKSLPQCNIMDVDNEKAFRVINAKVVYNGSTVSVSGVQGNIGDCPASITLTTPLYARPAGNKFEVCDIVTVDQLIDLPANGFDYSESTSIAERPESNCSSGSVSFSQCNANITNNCKSLASPYNNPPDAVLIHRINHAPTPGEKDRLKDILVRKYVIEERITDAENIIKNETALEIRKLRVSQALKNKNFAGCQNELDNIALDGTAETENFKLFHQQLVNICSQGRKLKDITPTERQNIERVANSTTGVRVEAEAMLAQLDRKQIIRTPENLSSSSTARMSNQNINVETNNARSISSLSLYPNPTHNLVSIHYNYEFKDSEKEIRIINLVTGQNLNTTPINSLKGTENVNVVDLSNGIYVVQMLENNAVIEVERLVVFH